MTKAAELAKIISASGVVSGVGFTAGNAVLAEAELELLDGLTAGTAIASKVITTDANIDSTGMRNLTISGELDAATLDISGNVDIDGTLETDAFSIASTAVTSTAAELNILDGVTSTATELNLLDGVTSTTAELNILDGVTSTAAELNILDGVTSTAAELNILDGVTSTATELNLLDGVTSTTAELNILDGVTSTAAELNILDGVTSTAAELNILDGVTASATDINLIDGITNGTVIASKAIITDSNKDITGGRNITISGELDAATLDISGAIDVAGTTNLDVVDIDGAVNMATTALVTGVLTTTAVPLFNGGIDLPTVNTFIKGGGHNVVQVDSTKTYLYGGTGGVQFRTADNASGIVDITNNGIVTMPAQPAFLVRPASTQNNFAVGSEVVVVFGTEVFDRNADFASNTFTAPVTGLYQFNASLRLEGVDSASSYYYIDIRTSNRDYQFIFDPDFGQDNAYFTMVVSCLADMDAGDTADVAILQGSGTQQTDIMIQSHFSGYLVA